VGEHDLILGDPSYTFTIKFLNKIKKINTNTNTLLTFKRRTL
jgi:hypothetical protein